MAAEKTEDVLSVLVAGDQPNHQAQGSEQKEQKDFDINSIGSVVRYLPVFDQSTHCYDLAGAAGRLYLPHWNHHILDIVDATTGQLLTRWGTFKQAGQADIGQAPQFNYPWGVAVDEARGRLYVTDRSNHRVVVIRLSDGVVEAVWGSQGTGPDQFNFPCSVAYCPTTDLLYVSDNVNHCVKVLRCSDGQFVQVLGSGEESSGSHQMKHPQGVAVDADHVYIADGGNHRVLVYSKQHGDFLFQIGEGGEGGGGDNQFRTPSGVSVDSEAGVVYVADHTNRRVCVYRCADGGYVRQFPVLQPDNTSGKPWAVMWDAAQRVLYVAVWNSTTFCVYQG